MSYPEKSWLSLKWIREAFFNWLRVEKLVPNCLKIKGGQKSEHFTKFYDFSHIKRPKMRKKSYFIHKFQYKKKILNLASKRSIFGEP